MWTSTKATWAIPVPWAVDLWPRMKHRWSRMRLEFRVYAGMNVGQVSDLPVRGVSRLRQTPPAAMPSKIAPDGNRVHLVHPVHPVEKNIRNSGEITGKEIAGNRWNLPEIAGNFGGNRRKSPGITGNRWTGNGLQNVAFCAAIYRLQEIGGNHRKLLEIGGQENDYLDLAF